MRHFTGNSDLREDGITLFGANPNEILSAFHNSGLAEKGYSILGRIIPNQANLINNEGQSQALFGGETMYSATFVRRA